MDGLYPDKLFESILRIILVNLRSRSKPHAPKLTLDKSMAGPTSDRKVKARLTLDAVMRIGNISNI